MKRIMIWSMLLVGLGSAEVHGQGRCGRKSGGVCSVAGADRSGCYRGDCLSWASVNNQLNNVGQVISTNQTLP